MKNLSLSGWKKKVWKVFSLWIRNRDSWTCYTCGCAGALMQAGHFIPRQHSATLFDEMNVHAQCARENLYGNGAPHVYAQKLIAQYGQAEFDALVERGKSTKKFTIPELRGLYEKYKSL